MPLVAVLIPSKRVVSTRTPSRLLLLVPLLSFFLLLGELLQSLLQFSFLRLLLLLPHTQLVDLSCDFRKLLLLFRSVLLLPLTYIVFPFLGHLPFPSYRLHLNFQPFQPILEAPHPSLYRRRLLVRHFGSSPALLDLLLQRQRLLLSTHVQCPSFMYDFLHRLDFGAKSSFRSLRRSSSLLDLRLQTILLRMSCGYEMSDLCGLRVGGIEDVGEYSRDMRVSHTVGGRRCCASR